MLIIGQKKNKGRLYHGSFVQKPMILYNTGADNIHGVYRGLSCAPILKKILTMIDKNSQPEIVETRVEFSGDIVGACTSEQRAGQAQDPICVFYSWYQLVLAQAVPQPNTMILATSNAQAQPSARAVLLKKVSAEGFFFFSNYESQKGQELAANPFAALVFYWPALKRQVRVMGRVSRISHEASLAYFHTRSRESQISAWASRQSTTIKDRHQLEKQVKEIETRYAARELPLPPYWGGYCVSPHAMEFWSGQANRLHDRIQYTRRAGHPWELRRLAP